MQPTQPLAGNLQQIRLRRGWTIDDAATATGFDASVLEGIERGVTFLSRTRTQDLAERLGVTVQDLTG